MKVEGICRCNACTLKSQGYAAEMDNPAMAHLIPGTLLSKKDVLFGNMSEIYQFHKRYDSFTQFTQPQTVVIYKPFFSVYWLFLEGPVCSEISVFRCVF